MVVAEAVSEIILEETTTVAEDLAEMTSPEVDEEVDSTRGIEILTTGTVEATEMATGVAAVGVVEIVAALIGTNNEEVAVEVLTGIEVDSTRGEAVVSCGRLEDIHVITEL